jgi:hypothetical protein
MTSSPGTRGLAAGQPTQGSTYKYLGSTSSATNHIPRHVNCGGGTCPLPKITPVLQREYTPQPSSHRHSRHMPPTQAGALALHQARHNHAASMVPGMYQRMYFATIPRYKAHRTVPQRGGRLPQRQRPRSRHVPKAQGLRCGPGSQQQCCGRQAFPGAARAGLPRAAGEHLPPGWTIAVHCGLPQTSGQRSFMTHKLREPGTQLSLPSQPGQPGQLRRRPHAEQCPGWWPSAWLLPVRPSRCC